MSEEGLGYMPMNQPVEAPPAAAPAQQPGIPTQQQMGPQGGILKLSVRNQQGQSGEVSDRDIMSQLVSAGQRPTGISQDGMTMTFADDQGSYEVDTRHVLEELGWSVTGGSPTNANYDHVQHDWRAAVNKLPDDDMRQAYLTAKMQRAGDKNPQIIGQGRDWFVFNPKSAQWLGVTNNPDWDSSDLVEGGMDVTRAMGSMAGATAGAFAGPAGAMAGAAGGGGAVDVATRAGMAAYDPDYAGIMNKNWGAAAGDVAKQAGVDALGQGIFGAIPGIAKKMFGNGAEEVANYGLRKGVGSTAMKWGGRGMEAAGDLSQAAAKPFQSEMGKDIASQFAPVLGDVSGAGWISQLPSEAAKMAGKAPGWAANALNSSMLSRLFGEETMAGVRNKLGSEGWKDLSEQLLQKRGGASMAEEISSRLGGVGSSQAPGAKDVLGNMAEKFANRFTSPGELLASGGVERHASSAAGSAFDDGIAQGLSHQEAADMAMKAARQIRETARSLGQSGIKAAEGVGQAADALGSAGRGAIGLSRSAIGAGANVLKHGGYGASKLGRGLQNVGTVMQPVENYALLRKGLDEYGPQAEEALGMKKRRSWHPPMSQGTMYVGN